MLLRCTLGCNAGSLLDRHGRPVLPEYTYKAIRKCNTKTVLMCLIDEWLVFGWRHCEDAIKRISTGFIG